MKGERGKRRSQETFCKSKLEALTDSCGGICRCESSLARYGSLLRSDHKCPEIKRD